MYIKQNKQNISQQLLSAFVLEQGTAFTMKPLQKRRHRSERFPGISGNESLFSEILSSSSPFQGSGSPPLDQGAFGQRR